MRIILLLTVHLKATSDRPEIKIDWRIYTKNPDNPVIRDLIIEGLSLQEHKKRSLLQY
jgi:phospholipid transport system substrate-binding protein